MEGGNLRNALQELQQIIITPIKAYNPVSTAQPALDTASSPSEATKTGADKEPSSEGFQSHNPPPCDGDSSVTPISDGDIAGQFTRVMGKGKNIKINLFNIQWMLVFNSKYILRTFIYTHTHTLYKSKDIPLIKWSLDMDI